MAGVESVVAAAYKPAGNLWFVAYVLVVIDSRRFVTPWHVGVVFHSWAGKMRYW